MANDEQVRLLHEGVSVWNAWRQAHPEGAIDLMYAALDQFDLPGIDFSNAEMYGVHLCTANLQGANFHGSKINGADLSFCDLRSADFSGAELQGTYLYESDLREANLSHTLLGEAELDGARLMGAILRGADVRETAFCRSDLRGADLTGVDLNEANTERAVFGEIAQEELQTESHLHWTAETEGDLPEPLHGEKMGTFSQFMQDSLLSEEMTAVIEEHGRHALKGREEQQGIPSEAGEAVPPMVILQRAEDSPPLSQSGSERPYSGITHASASITEYPIPTSQSRPQQIVAGPDGSFWFTELNGNQIGRITPDGRITEYPLPRFQSRPYGIAAGPDGNLWFTKVNDNQIGCMTLLVALPVVFSRFYCLETDCVRHRTREKTRRRILSFIG